MTFSGRLSALIAATLMTTCLGVLTASWTPSATAVEVVQDGGLEGATGDPLDSPAWTETQSVGTGTPLCSLDTCGVEDGTILPHDGTKFAAFRFRGAGPFTASLSQVVTIPDGAATLSYWIRISQVSAPVDAELAVRIDGHVVRTHREGTVPDPGYTEVSVDLAEYADGGSHTLSFDFTDPANTGSDTILLDDVSIQAAPLPAGFAAEPGTLGEIPDGPAICATPSASRDVAFDVTGIPGGVSDVAVRFKLAPEHTWVGDLVVQLIAPGGTAAAVLFARTGPNSAVHVAGPYLFSDFAPAAPSWWAIAARYAFDGTIPAGSYRASAPGNGENTSLTAPFAGLADVNGTWTLRFQDFCNNDTGTVASAKLLLTPAAIAPETTPPDTTAPDTVITSAPAKGVAKSLTVPFGFAASEPGATFSCALDGAAYAACTPPLNLQVTPGAHTLRVAAADAAGNLDATPATASFQAFDCKTLDATVTKLAHKTKLLKKSVKATKAKLAKAKADGDKAKAKQLQAKLTKQQKQLKKATKQHQVAVAAAAPCHT